MSRMVKGSILGIMVLTILGIASFANAEVVEYVYDFDNLSTTYASPSGAVGDLLGQDGWYDIGASRYDGTNYLVVKSDATSPMSGNYLYKGGDDYAGNIYLARINDGNWSYSITADTDWELSGLVNVDTENTGPTAMMYIDQTVGDVRSSTYCFWVGSGGTNSDIHWKVFGSLYSTNVSVAGIYKVGMSAEALGGNNYDVAIWYEATPGDESTRVIFDTIEGVNADMTTYNSMTANMWCKGASYPVAMLDDFTIRVGEVPEPSTLALLGCGLIGLLAYAWRKRK